LAVRHSSGVAFLAAKNPVKPAQSPNFQVIRLKEHTAGTLLKLVAKLPALHPECGVETKV
jgi:hypothetical protein